MPLNTTYTSDKQQIAKKQSAYFTSSHIYAEKKFFNTHNNNSLREM